MEDALADDFDFEQYWDSPCKTCGHEGKRHVDYKILTHDDGNSFSYVLDSCNAVIDCPDPQEVFQRVGTACLVLHYCPCKEYAIA